MGKFIPSRNDWRLATGYGKVHPVTERLPVGFESGNVRVVDKFGVLFVRNLCSQCFAPDDLIFVALRCFLRRLERH